MTCSDGKEGKGDRGQEGEDEEGSGRRTRNRMEEAGVGMYENRLCISACKCDNLGLECISTFDSVRRLSHAVVGLNVSVCIRTPFPNSCLPRFGFCLLYLSTLPGTCSTSSDPEELQFQPSLSVSKVCCRTTCSSSAGSSGRGGRPSTATSRRSVARSTGAVAAAGSRRRMMAPFLRRLVEMAWRLLAAASLFLGRDAAKDDLFVAVGEGTVMRRAARFIGGARRPWPRRRSRHARGIALQLVPRAVPLGSCTAASPGVPKRVGAAPAGGAEVSRTRIARRNNMKPLGGGCEDGAAMARAIVRGTLRLRKARKGVDEARGDQCLGGARAESATEEMVKHECPGGAEQVVDVHRCRGGVGVGPAQCTMGGPKQTVRTRRAEVAWLRRTSRRLAHRDGRPNEADRASGKRRKALRPTLQWTGPPSWGCGQRCGIQRASTVSFKPLRVLAAAATVAGAVLVDGIPPAVDAMQSNALRQWSCRRGAGGIDGGAVRYGEALHPGPGSPYDDPEFFGEYGDLDHDVRAIAEADGVMSAGFGQVETMAQELMGFVDSGHTDLTGAAIIGVGLGEDVDAQARPWWGIRLGDDCDFDCADIGSASQEALLATAFPPSQATQRADTRNELGQAHYGFVGQDCSHNEPLVEEVAARPSPGGGVPLPQGLFKTLQEEDDRRAEFMAEKWSRLRRLQVERRDVVSAHREQARAARVLGSTGTLAAALKPCNVPREPKIEEVQETHVVGSSATENVSGDGESLAPLARGCEEADRQGRTYARRARGRRQRGVHEGEVWLLNSSGKPQLEAAIRCANGERGTCIAILNQEHHQTSANLADLQAAARSQGWTAAAVAAVGGGAGGPSAGVAVLTPTHIASGLGVGLKVDISPKGSDGRLAQLWCQKVVPSGVLCISVYLHTNEGATPRNVALISRALSTAVASGCPWIVAGDLQDSPESFMRWAGSMLRKAGGRVVAPEEPTHYPGRGEARVLDFFVVADVLAPFVKGARVLRQVVASPHRAVALAFRSVGPPPLHWQRRAPRPFPRQPPVGCARAPVAPMLGEIDGTAQREREAEVPVGAVMEGVTDAQGVKSDEKIRRDRHEYATRAWCRLSDSIEAEMCGRTDRWEGEHPDRRWCGRAEGPRYVQGPALPPRAAGAWGSMDMKTHAMAWVGNRMTELRNLSVIAEGRLRAAEPSESNTGLSAGQLKQWHRVISKVLGSRSPLARFLSGVQWEQLRAELRRRRPAPALATDFLEGTSAWVMQLVQSQRKANASCRLKDWRAWIAKQLKDGGAAIYKFAKRAEEAPEELIVLRGVASADPQDMVDKDFGDWGMVWNKLRHLAAAPWREDGCGGPSCLPQPTHVELRAAAATFPPWTGTSSELLTPRHYTWLSDLLLSRIGAFLGLLESWGLWPQQLMEALICLIPKPAGGRRPIGLLASLVRLWERVRRPYVVDWRVKVHREYNWMARGRGAARAVWAQTVVEEAARQRGLASAAVLIDLVKAFEMVILARVWNDGLELEFPRELLRLSMEVCSFGRRLVYRGAYSMGTIHTLTAILAGSGYATDFMFIMIMRAVDLILRRYENVDACVIADDVKFSVTGEEDRVAADIGRVAEDFVDIVERRLNMEVSRAKGSKEGKTVALVSSGRLAVKVRTKMRSMGIAVARQARNLGVDFRLGGGQIRRPVQKGRAVKIAPRQARARRMGGRAAEKVAIACDIPSATYGSSITGVTDGMLATMRKGVAAATGALAGRSVSGRLLMTGRDPGVTVVVGAVYDWVAAWWDTLVPRGCMSDALRQAQKTVGLSARPNVAVRGGAGAYVAALRRLAWAAPRADVVRTRDGTLLFFGDGAPPEGTWPVDPRTVRRWAMDDYEIAIMGTSMVAQDINEVGGSRGYGRAREVSAEGEARYYGGSDAEAALCGVWRRAHYECAEGLAVPWIWPAARAARAAWRNGRTQGAASLRACVEGGWWTQSRLHACGIASTSRCSCGEAVGTLWHKLGACKLAEQARANGLPTGLLRMGKKSVWDPLFSRGVAARPKVPRPPKTRSWWTRCAAQAEQLATGTVFTDGAYQGWFWKGARAAWAAVAVTDDGVVLWRLQGVIGEPHPSILRAELMALREVLRMAAPPLTVYIDNKQVVDGFDKGRAYCTASTTDAADIWRDVWRLVEDIGPGVTVRKVRAHTTWWDVLAGRITPFLRWGNAEADRAAKEALRIAISEAPHQAYNAQLARAFLWSKWIVEYAASWVHDTTRHAEDVDEAALGGGAAVRARAPRGTLPHEIWQTSAHTLCRRCGRERQREKEGGGFQLEPCRGSAAGRALASARGDKNQLWFRYYLSVPDMIRRGATLLSRSVVPMTLVDLDSIDRLNIEGESGEAVESAAAAEAAARRAASPTAALGGEAAIAQHQQRESQHPFHDHHHHRQLHPVHGQRRWPHGVRRGRDGRPLVPAVVPPAQADAGETLDDVAGGVGGDGPGGRTMRSAVEGAAGSGQAERNVRRRVTEEGAGGPNIEPAARDDDGADLDGRRVRQRGENKLRDSSEPRELSWIREPSWMPDWMPRLPPLPPGDGAGREPARRLRVERQEPSGGDARAGEGAHAAAVTSSGHVLRITGSLVWCARCAAYAARRWGARLRGVCRPGMGDATRSRLEALSQGRHPITGAQLF